MQFDTACGLCRDSRGSTVLQETENFVTFPGLGQFSPSGGYLVTVTKDHQYASSSAFSEELFDELEQVMREAASVVESVMHVRPLFFEHGSTCHSRAGQCVTHMHMNLIPFELDLRRYVARPGVQVLDQLKDLMNVEPPYLYIRTPEGQHIALPVGSQEVPSQYLRMAIGIELGHPERSFWDWRIRRATDEGADDEDAIDATMHSLEGTFSIRTPNLKTWSSPQEGVSVGR